jgi:AcrR family transcriptional regulator
MARTAQPSPDRQRDRSDSRRRILEVATREFAAKGLAGARVDLIAQKAGCNKQLIYYYFGGKDALYDEVLGSMMAATRREQPAPATSLGELITRHLSSTSLRRRWVRLLSWEGLQGKLSRILREDERRLVWRRDVDALAELQAQGEVDPAFDPEMLGVVLHGLRLFPELLPQVTYMTTGLDPESPAFEERYAALLEQLAARLKPSPDVSDG